MSLLPKTHTEFASKSYWDTFFSKRSDSFEWYGDYHDLCGVLHKYSKPSSKVLIAGCGNSTLSEDLYDVGYRDIQSVDISDVAIRQMSERNRTKRPELVFSKMDILATEYEDGRFEVVIDKGTCDALCTDRNKGTMQTMAAMFREIARVLKSGGRYMCVSLAQDHVLDTVLENFREGWVVRVHVVAMEEKAGPDMGGDLPVFVFVMTKMLTIPGKPAIKVFEVVVDGDGQITRLGSSEGIRDTIKSLQQFSMLRHYFRRIHIGEACSVDLWHPDVPEEPRFTVSVVDTAHQMARNGEFAIFLVPHGHESHWLFSADEGLLQLANSAGYHRLVVVNLHRLHRYGSLDEVRDEVSATAVEFVHSRAAAGGQRKWPVLTLGEDLGKRTVRHKGYSEFSGQFVVEDLFDKKTGINSRRLIFLNAPRVVQTEVKLVKASKKGKTLIVDPKALMSNYQMVMISTLGFLATDDRNHGNPVKVLIIGLGGGSLSTYISRHFRNVLLEVVELDQAMLEVARSWFGFRSHDSLVTHIGDGIQFVREASEKGLQWDLVCVDVDNKDHHQGVSCPPAGFIERAFLSSVQKILSNNGFCLLNLVARNKDKRQAMIDSIKQVFPRILDCTLSEDVNEVVLLPHKLKNLVPLESGGITKETAATKTEALLKVLANDPKFLDTVKSTFSRSLSLFTEV